MQKSNVKKRTKKSETLVMCDLLTQSTETTCCTLYVTVFGGLMRLKYELDSEPVQSVEVRA